MNDNKYDLIINNAEISSTELLINKGLYANDAFNNKYCLLYNNYRILFEKYLLSKLPLKKYDDMIFNSQLRFIPMDKENTDYYQYISTMNLKYIYLRNDLYVEKLSLQDIELIINLSGEELNNPSNKLFKLIETTYMDVINPDINNNEITNKYDWDNPRQWFKSTELVFGVMHDISADNGLGQNDGWLDNYCNQNVFLNDLIDKMIQDFSRIMHKNVNLVWYDEFSIRKKIR